MKLSVHLQDPPDPAALSLLREQLDPRVELTLGPTLPRPARFQILVDGRPTRERLLASGALTTLIVPWAGLPQKTRALLLDFPHIAAHNLHYNAAATAEMAVTLMLAAAKFVVPIDAAMRRGDWSVRYGGDRSVEVAGKRALVLGYGAIGRRVAAACIGLGMNVVVIRRSVSKDGRPSHGLEFFAPSQLRAQLSRADALLVCLPLTPSTSGWIGAHELNLLHPRAILVNVGRGPIVDEAALFDALKSGRLYAAGLDVWYRYPENEAARRSTRPSRFPFWELDNVTLSPHRAGDNSETEAKRMVGLARLINAAALAEPLPDRLDVEAGY